MKSRWPTYRVTFEIRDTDQPCEPAIDVPPPDGCPLAHCLGPASPSREAPVGHRHRRQVRCCRGQGYRRIARNALVSKSDRCGSAERPGRGHGAALDIPARLAYLPSLTIILDLRTFIGGGIPMMRDELVGSVVLGAMAALISMLVWGRSLVDLIAAGT